MLNVFIYRGALVESSHKVIVAVSDSKGNIFEHYGDTKTLIYPRSAVKPIQALPLVLSGALRQYSLTSKELAMAAASHNGEPFQVACVESWLKRLNLSHMDLECGIHPPSHVDSAYNIIRLGQKFTSLHNNCSGKHTGMLCLAKQLKEPCIGYIEASHSVQRYIKNTIEELIDYPIPNDSYGIDGCSIPTWSIPISKFALGLARFADPEFPNKKLANACEIIFNACVNNPEYIAGTDRFCTILMRECGKQVLIKIGAEGVMSAIIKHPKPIGIAIKCLDGSSRAAEAVLAFILNKYRVLSDNSSYLEKKIVNWNNIQTGYIEVSY